MDLRTYSKLIQRPTFDERFEYLSLGGDVGAATFGYDRWLNQAFYRSREWKQVRNYVIARDEANDLGVPGHLIYRDLLVHHMNPITPEQLERGEESVLDPEYLITTMKRTHNAIHFGDANLLQRAPVVRRPGDTKLW